MPHFRGGDHMALVIKDTSTRDSWTFPETKQGYAEFAAKKQDILAQGHGVSDERSGSLAKNESFHQNTGNIYNSGPASSMATGSGSAFNSIFGF
jgi:hypothetical protein